MTSRVTITTERTLSVLLIVMVKVASSSLTEAPPTLQTGPQCSDWGVSGDVSVGVYEGESGRIWCPLFSMRSIYTYNPASGLTLLWYRHTHTHELEQPIDLRTHTFIKHRDSLWIQTASLQDSGTYICMLRNSSLCARMGVQVQVFRRDGVCDGTLHTNVSVPIHSSHTLHCPNLQHLPSSSYNVTWYHHCESLYTDFNREVRGDELMIHIMFIRFGGSYTCLVSYQSNGLSLQLTHTINVRPVSPSGGPKQPSVLNPAADQVYTVTVGEDVELLCKAFLPYLEEEQQVWWTVDNKTMEELADPRYTSPPTRLEFDDYGDQTVLKALYVSQFSVSDLQREFRCSAHNSRGFSSSVANIQEHVYIPSVELGVGLSVTLAVAVLLFVVYRVFKLELLLLYRSWFGTDERDSDDKKYDVYISYARNGEEEEFVMTTLRRVLEAELGYSVCIFDRDSLPGGTITDETLRFVACSRRLLVVVSALSAVRGTQALLELQAGLALLRGGRLRLLLVQYRHVDRQSWLRELRRARVALKLITWQGDKSLPLSSRFWKQLQLELPVSKQKYTNKQHRKGSNTTTIPLTECKTAEESTTLTLDTSHT